VDRPPARLNWRAFLEAGVVAGLAFAALVPYLYYLTRIAFADALKQRFGNTSTEQLLRVDLVLIGIALIICSLVGSLLARRYRLPGLGSMAAVRRALPYIVPGGALLSAGTYLFFGRHLARRVPGYYPASLGWALLVMVKGAFFDETIARFGMMTIFSGVVRHLWLANLLQAAFLTFITTRSLPFFGIAVDWNPFLVASVGSSVVVHLAHGWTYGRFGLLSAAALHLLVDSKYALHALIGTTLAPAGPGG
jgi:hypothetical protein